MKQQKNPENQKNIEKQLSRANSQLKTYKRFVQKSWVLLSIVISKKNKEYLFKNLEFLKTNLKINIIIKLLFSFIVLICEFTIVNDHHY